MLAVYGLFVGLLLLTAFGGEGYFATTAFDAPVVTQPITWAVLIGVMCILLCYIFNIRGMRPAVWFSYVVGALMILPVGTIAIGAFITGDFSNHQIDSNLLAETPTVYGDPGNGFHQFALVMVWLYIIGWSTYGPEAAATFAPEYKDTRNDTRKALAWTGGINVLLAFLLPIAVLGTIGYDNILADPYGVPYLVEVLRTIAGEGFGTFLTVCLCGGLLLSMNTATMDGSRALYALSEEKMTIKQLGVLNKRPRPGPRDDRGHAAEHLPHPLLRKHLLHPRGGQLRLHVLARARALGCPAPSQGQAELAETDQAGEAVDGRGRLLAIANLLFIIFGLAFMDYTGYLWNADFTDAWAKLPEMIGVAVGSLAAGVIGYVIAQHQHGRPFRWREPSDELPSQEAIDSAAAARQAAKPRRLQAAKREGRVHPPLVYKQRSLQRSRRTREGRGNPPLRVFVEYNRQKARGDSDHHPVRMRRDALGRSRR